jgi:alpha-ketoglutarate-dependent taurine dioxygenase
MTFSLTTTWSITRLSPFGILATTNPGADIYAVPTPVLHTWAVEHHLVVLRGFAPLAAEELPEFCETLGEMLEWDLNTEGQSRVRVDDKTSLNPQRPVPLHWDGIFATQTPRLIFFHCDEAPLPGAGGEALFCNTIRLLDRTPQEDSALWEQIEITYARGHDDRHTAPLIMPHPISGERTLRFAGPGLGQNRLELQVSGILEEATGAFIDELHERLHHPAVCYTHAWHDGDIILADNYALLHGRRALQEGATRCVRRVNIR